MRCQYPSTSRWATQEARGGAATDFAGQAPLPAAPTSALPGSEEKIRVMSERAMRGEAIFHPQDRRFGEDRDEAYAAPTPIPLDPTDPFRVDDNEG